MEGWSGVSLHTNELHPRPVKRLGSALSGRPRNRRLNPAPLRLFMDLFRALVLGTPSSACWISSGLAKSEGEIPGRGWKESSTLQWGCHQSVLNTDVRQSYQECILNVIQQGSNLGRTEEGLERLQGGEGPEERLGHEEVRRKNQDVTERARPRPSKIPGARSNVDLTHFCLFYIC